MGQHLASSLLKGSAWQGELTDEAGKKKIFMAYHDELKKYPCFVSFFHESSDEKLSLKDLNLPSHFPWSPKSHLPVLSLLACMAGTDF